MQKPEDDKMQRPEENKNLDGLKKDELLERARELEAQNSSLVAENAVLTDRAKQGENLLGDAVEHGKLPEYPMEIVQFHEDYNHAGVGTGNKRVKAHKEFFARGGEVVYMPKPLLARIQRYNPLVKMNVGKDNIEDRRIGRLEFDPKTGRRKPVEEVVPAKKVIEEARTVGEAEVR